MLASNTILQDRYRVVRKLGQGGMGAIYEALDQRVSCVVALKETLVGSSSEARAAFQREAALLANLRHPALPKVMDYFGEGDGEFLVMEFIPGQDLVELLALREGPFPQRQVLRWGIELLKLLEYLHLLEPPVLHRDIKPANLKATKQGDLFLLDFGLAKGAAGQMATLETNRSVQGYTPVYAPLEQILGQGTDQRSDLYSLGATLYHILTGQAPVSAPARFDAGENNRPDPLKLANQLNLEIASEVAACIQKAMSLSRKDRFSSAAEMRIALENAAKLVDDREAVRKAEAALVETQPSVPDDASDRPRVADKDVQFTVYAPQKVRPEKNYTVLAFAHLSKRRSDAAEDEPDPIAEMKEQAARVLGDQRADYRDVKESSSQPVPQGGELTFVPVVKGLTFNPPRRSFSWRKSIHREEFDVQASVEIDGQTLNGSMTVFLGSVIIAEVLLTISVDSRATSEAERIPLNEPRSARRVRQVFASYSHKDEQVVAELAHVAPLFGSRFLMDRTHLEPGEDRNEGLQRLIREADVFQLFWSTNSMRSADTAGEIKYAASLGRPGFILPTYWEEPVPRSPAEGLPPPEIERLQFYRIYPGAISQATNRTIDAQLKSAPVTASLEMPHDDAPTGEIMAAPLTMAAPSASSSYFDRLPAVVVVCPVCETQYAPGMKFCARCGRTLPQTQAVDAISQASPVAASPTMQSYQVPVVAKRKRGIMVPIYAGAAMLLLVMILAPAFFMMKNKRIDSEPPLSGSNPIPKNNNTTANVNSDFESDPDGQFASINGGKVRLKDFRGRVVLLNFWATGNALSRNEIPILNDLQKTHGPRGLSVIGLSKNDTADQVRQFQQEIPQDYLIGFHGREIEAQLPASTLPTTYIIDRRGRVRKKMIGTQSRAAFEAAIEPLINEEP